APAARATVASRALVAALTNFTLPVGVPAPAAAADTVAVRLPGPPVAVVGWPARLVADCALPTVCETGAEVMAPELASPFQAAVRECVPTGKFTTVRAA